MFQSKLVNHLSVLVSFALVLTACGGGAATETPATEAPTQAPVTEPPTEAPATEVSTEAPATEAPATEVPATEAPATDNKTLTFGVWGATSPNNFCTFSPTTGVDEIWRNRFVGATLMTLNENNQWAPNLAESYEANEDGTAYVFKLYQGVKWHDSADFTAQDVVFTFDLLLNQDTGNYGALFRDIVEKVEAPDDYTVVFYMKRPVFSEDFRIKSDFWNIVQGWIPVPQHILEGIPLAEICSSNWAQSQYVGLGPFAVVEFVADDHVIYQPFQDYHLGPSQLEQLTIQFSSDPNFLFLSLLAGDVDMAQITPEYIDDIEQQNEFLLPPDASLIAVNTSRIDWPPADPYVQQALVESLQETFVPYRETLDIGDADLFPLYPEMSAAIDSLKDTIQGEFNLSRAVRIVNEGVTVLWMPIGPESAQAYANVGSVDEFWAIVNKNGGLNLGIEVIEEELPVAVWAYVTDNGREIWLIKSDGTVFTSYGEGAFEYGMDTAVEIPVAQITIGTTWCSGRIGSFWIKYPCW